MSLMGGIKRTGGSQVKDVIVDEEGRIITDAVIEFTEHPFAKGNLTSNGVQYCTEVTQGASTNTDYTVETVTVGTNHPPGKVVGLEFGLTGSFAAASTTTADLKYQWQARSKEFNGSWLGLHSQVTKTNINTTNVEETYSGVFATVDKDGLIPSEVSRVPLEVRLRIQSNEASQAQGKTKSSSYVTVKYIPD